MNWLLILVAGVLIGNALWGYKKGFMKVALSLVSWVAVLVVVYIGTPIMADIIKANTPIEGIIEENFTMVINEAITSANFEDIAAALPQEVRELLDKSGILNNLNGGDVLPPDTAEKILESTGLAGSIISLLSAVVVAIVARIALLIAEFILGIAAKLPLIGPMDKLAGLGFGALKGLIWCWLILAIIGILALTGTNTELMALVHESEILTWLYDNNVIMNMLVKL